MSRATILSTVAGLSAGVWVDAAGPTTGPATAPTAAATTAVATTAPTTRTVPNEQIEAAIRQLSADGWKQRKAAQDTLVTFGDAAVPRLRELAARAADQEVRTRAAAALAQVEQDAQFGGSIVTLHFTDARPQDVFAELARQARCELPTYPPTLWAQPNRGGGAARTISVDLDRVPFWTAFKEACTKANVFPQQFGTDRRMALGQGSINYWNGPSVVTGPFMVVANRIYRSDSIDLANPGAVQRDFHVQLTAFAEPKVRVIQSSYNVRIDEAVDDQGNSLVAAEPVVHGMAGGQQWLWNVSARLAYPANPGKRIVRLRGGMRFVVQTKAETLDVPDVLAAKNLRKTVAGRRVLVKEVKQTGQQYEVQMTVYRDGLAQAEWNALSNPGYAIRLLDEKGRGLASRGWDSNGSGTEMNYAWRFTRDNWGGPDGRPDEPHRLVWEIPTETREMAADFTFKDLPMP